MKTITLKDFGWGSSIGAVWEDTKRHGGSILRHLTWRRLCNLVVLAVELGLRRRSVFSRPIAIKIDPANICNFHCPGCRTGQGDESVPKGRITYEHFQDIVDRTYRDAFKLFLYMWGEPFLHNDIFRMIEYAAAKNLSVQLSSNMNARLASDADAIVQSGLEYLVVALDGASQETYEVYRVGGQFETVVDNLKSLIEARKRRRQNFPRIELQFIVFPHNKHEVAAVEELARTLGVDRLTFIDSVGNNLGERDQLAQRDEKRADKCNALWMLACFNWNGTFSPCCDAVDDSFGNILTHSLSQLWNSTKMQKSRSLQTKRPITNGPKTKCSRCRIHGSSVTFLPEEADSSTDDSTSASARNTAHDSPSGVQ